MKLSVIIPAYNEETIIKNTLRELESYLNACDVCNSWEVIVVNDGSTDNTLKILKELKESERWLKVVDLVTNFGRGKALRKGFEESSGEVIVSLDADLSYAPDHIERMIDTLIKNNADLVLASAYRKGGTVQNVPFNRLWISRLGNKVLSYTFGGDITVLTCIARAYKKDFIEKIDLHSNTKDLHLEILHKAKILGAKIMEVPADLKWRDEKISSLEASNKRRSTLKLRKTSNSHFFFAMMNKPGFIFMVPGYFLLFISFLIFIQALRSILPDIISGTSFYFAIRNSMLNAKLSWMTLALSFVLAIQFFSLGFLTNQSKKNYEDTYRAVNTILTKLKKMKG